MFPVADVVVADVVVVVIVLPCHARTSVALFTYDSKQQPFVPFPVVTFFSVPVTKYPG